MGPELFEVAAQHGLATPSQQPYAPRPGSLAAEYVAALSALRTAKRRGNAWRTVAMLASLAVLGVTLAWWLS